MSKLPGEVTFIEDPNFAAEVVRTTAVKELLEALAEEGAALYRDGVPVDEGELRDSVFSDVQLTEDGYVGRIGSTSWKAGLVELGSSKSPPSGALRRALESVGFKIEEIGL